MVRDEVLRALDDPGEIAHAELIGLGKRGSERQSCGVAERPRSAGCDLGSVLVEPLPADLLGGLQIETQEIAMIGHSNILTCVVLRDA